MKAQHGQKKIREGLHKVIIDESQNGFPSILPVKMKYMWELSKEQPPRIAADCIASLSEREAVGLHGRVYGISDSSILDPIVR